jgi:hypothetical protein
VASVRLQLFKSGKKVRNRLENVAPFALYGHKSEDYLGKKLLAGSYTVTAQPFSGIDQSGVKGDTVTAAFSVSSSRRLGSPSI